jgi:hypothetical protein
LLKLGSALDEGIEVTFTTRSLAMFPMVTCNLAVIAIAAIYLTWKDRAVARQRRRDVLRERVAYMLWTAAQQRQG